MFSIHPKCRTFRRAMATALIGPAAFAAIGGALLLVASPVVTAEVRWTDGPRAESTDRGTDAMQFEKHLCWTGAAPARYAEAFPGHVLIATDGNLRLGGARMVGKALEQIFDGADHGLVVRAFCA